MPQEQPIGTYTNIVYVTVTPKRHVLTRTILDNLAQRCGLTFFRNGTDHFVYRYEGIHKESIVAFCSGLKSRAKCDVNPPLQNWI
jgi:hypothetical protein